MSSFVKDPDATLDYTINWANWLEGDEISTSVWTVETGLTEPRPPVMDTSSTTVWLSGGTVGVAYSVQNRISTVAGRIDDRTLTISIEEK